MTSLVVVDDHKIVRDGVRQIVSLRPDIELVAEAEDGIAAIALVKRWKPDLIILDVSMPLAGALEVSMELKRWSPKTQIIVFTGVNAGGVIRELVDLGVAAVVSKSDDAQVLCEAIDLALEGKRYISPAVSVVVGATEGLKSLTNRELQVLRFIASGQGNAEIAEMLSLSAKTVENHRANIMKKLDLHSVAQMMAFAFKQGLIEPESQ